MAELEKDFILSGESSQKPITVAVVIVYFDSPAEVSTNFRGKWAWSRGRLTLKPKILLASFKSCLTQPLQLSPSLPLLRIFPPLDPVAVSATGQSLLSGHGFTPPYDYSSH